MTLLEVFFIISWIIISLLALNIAKKQKFNALHFFVFLWVGWWLLIFTFFPKVLNFVWNLFWTSNWSDVLVYISVIFLIYFVLLLLRKIEKNKEDLTRLVREIAILEYKNKVEWKKMK